MLEVTEIGRVMVGKGRENDKGTNILTELKVKIYSPKLMEKEIKT